MGDEPPLRRLTNSIRFHTAASLLTKGEAWKEPATLREGTPPCGGGGGKLKGRLSVTHRKFPLMDRWSGAVRSCVSVTYRGQAGFFCSHVIIFWVRGDIGRLYYICYTMLMVNVDCIKKRVGEKVHERILLRRSYQRAGMSAAQTIPGLAQRPRRHDAALQQLL